MGVVIFPATETHQSQHIVGFGSPISGLHPLNLQAVAHIVDDPAMREKAEALKYHANRVAAQVAQLSFVHGGYIGIVDDDLPAGRFD